MTRSKHVELTRSLFDEEPAEQPAAVADDALDDWHDVPSARYFSWSRKMQLQYCYVRDLDSATRAENNTWAQFYLTRAAHYKADLEAHGD